LNWFLVSQLHSSKNLQELIWDLSTQTAQGRLSWVQLATDLWILTLLKVQNFIWCKSPPPYPAESDSW